MWCQALAVLAVIVTPAASSKLGRLLMRGRPLIVEVSQPDPAAAWALDVQELSANLREAGAAALLVPHTLMSVVVDEQARARGDFPGPLPVFCELEASQTILLSDLRSTGAAGVAVRCEQGATASGAALCELVVAAAAENLDVLAIATDDTSHAAAVGAGVMVVACTFADAPLPSSGSEGMPVVLGAWDGDDAELRRLRDNGFNAVLLLDGCGGDIAAGRAWCESRVRLFQSKASQSWGGSMFGSTSSDVAPPGARNARMWAQSQRQAREIMHESAKSRDLPPPKLKRNTVL